MAKTAAKNAGGKRKWVRQVSKKGIPLSAKKKHIRPYLEIVGHIDGTAVAFATQIDKKGDPREYYSAPICAKIEEDADCRKETGLSDVMYRRGVCGGKLPQSASSLFGWKCLVGTMYGGTEWQQAALLAIQKAAVEMWNRMGDDTEVFVYPSHIELGPSNSPADQLRLDQTLLDTDIVDIMKSAYGINVNSELAELAEDEDVVGLYFTCVSRGRTVLVDAASGLA